MIGHDLVGAGPRHAVVLNDWIGDTSTWDGARPYLDRDALTYAFADLRGYGRSRGQRGDFTVEEAAADVLTLADALQWARFAIVGHSMSTLVAFHLAQHHASRIDRAVLLTPPPPAGFGVDDERLAAMQALARGDDAHRLRGLRLMLGDHLSHGWVRFKGDRWRAGADAEAAASYVPMFARRGLPHPTVRADVPLLAVTGELDSEIMRRASVTSLLAPLCDRLEVVALGECGHYPMQEAPPLLVATIERFLVDR